ncbi:hypothetical protein CR152_26115 [Massilia violaceinigra]|uniref:Ice-binding protein C-terminal domain-containing protein n=1 Tax=Massilia violaceinigra TaxID=2045208 RepID=A0A2D2DRJ4_9BURK|nr:PEP-CTERM sorting domain-containing protein [Massilia violaceinigra]ATQ77590.1 hypothetical protein CR152_26115 [Massilia violaceinigra]
MYKSALALPLAALLAALPAQAQSTSTSTSSISNIRYTLIDLDLTDGDSPSFTPGYWEPQGSGLSVGVRDHDSGHEQYDSRHSPDVDFFDQQSIVFNTVTPGSQPKHVQVGAGISGTSLDSFAIIANANINGSGRGSGTSHVDLYRTFYLSPNTLLSISFDINTVATHTGPALHGWASSYASVWIGKQNAHFQHNAEVPGELPGQGGLQTFTITVQSDNSERLVNIGMEARSTSVLHDISPVPEPETYAMLLAGLGLIGWRRARRIAAR